MISPSLLSELEVRSAHTKNQGLGDELTSSVFFADIECFIVLVRFLGFKSKNT